MLVLVLVVCLSSVSAGDLWIRVDVKTIDKKLCGLDNPAWSADNSGCSSLSHMTLEERMLPTHERRSTSYEHIDGVSRPTVTYWPTGRFQDWMLAINFISVDPVYGIARTCDRSGYVRVFQNFTESLEEAEERLVKIEGQCFTALVLVRSSKGVCPWCTDNIKVANEAPLNKEQKKVQHEQLLLIVVLILTVITAVSLTGSAVVLCLFMCKRQQPPPIYDYSSRASSTGSAWKTSASVSNSNVRWQDEKWASLPETPGAASAGTTLYPEEIYENYVCDYDAVSQSTAADSGIA